MVRDNPRQFGSLWGVLYLCSKNIEGKQKKADGRPAILRFGNKAVVDN